MSEKKNHECPHCGSRLLPWQSPDMTTWGGRTQYICFNDECEYFVRGWKWMEEKFDQKVSYRHRLDPETGDAGPIPVWSKNALRESIGEKGEGKDES